MFLLQPEGWRGLAPANWAWAFTADVGGVYQPLAYLSYGLDYLLWGLDPRGYHLQNALWHAAASGLLALLMLRLVPDPVAAALAAIAFAVHPLRVESVSWISERRDVMCAALSLGATLAYVRGSDRAALGLFLLSLLSKGMAVTLPAVFFILDRYPLRRARPLKAYAPYLLLAAIFVLAGAGLQDRLRWSLEQHGPLARIAQASYAFCFYLAKTAWPSGLSPFYELRPPLDPLEPRFLAAFAGIALLAVLSRRRPWLAAALAAYAVMLAPVSGLFQFGPQLVADRYSYLTTVPFFVLLAAALRRRPWAGLALLPLAAACVAQQAHWRSTEALWTRALALDPVSGSAHLALGVERGRQGRHAEAEAEFRAALAAFPGCAEDQERAAAGDEQAARRVEWQPVCRKARANLGAALAAQGRVEEAERHLSVSAAIEPDNEAARRNLDRLRARAGRPAAPRRAARR